VNIGMVLPEGYTDLPPGKLANVATCLEMLERPEKPRPEPAGATATLVRVEAPDLDWYRRLFRRIGEPYLWFSRIALSDEELARIVYDPRVEIYAIEKDGDESGLLELDFRADGECEIVFFGFVEAAIGSGNGRRLMNRAIALAWSHPIRRLWLHTCSLDRPGAMAFYVRSGFRPYKRQIEYYDDPRLAGLLPETAAPDVPLL
jgi:GNAT superfamily N-acetyltransferase